MKFINKYLLFLSLSLLIGIMQLSATNVIISGQIDDQDGNAVNGHMVNAVIDGDTSIHVNNIYTDSSGFFSDTIFTPDADGIILVYTYDCENNYKEQIAHFNGDTQVDMDFEVCQDQNDNCQTDFYFMKDSLNDLKYYFYDNTVSDAQVMTFLWDFGDSTNSSMQNPTHVYSDSGQYLVSVHTWTASGCYSMHRDSINIYTDTSNCEANYYFVKDTLSGLMNYYHFFNNSSPSDQIVSYHWDFDDGTTDSTENPSHQFVNKGKYTVKLTITTQNGCTSTYSHVIQITQNVLSSCNADYTYYADTAINNKKYSFHDNSASYGSPIKYYFWDFGDGVTSIKKNPTHTFPNIGMYHVSLTVMTADSCTSTEQKKITVGNPSYYVLGGQVFYNSKPVDTFDVILYRDINNYLQPVDTTRFDTLGYYYFIDVIQGDYKVKIHTCDNSIYHQQSTPTYYDNDYLWNVSQSIPLDAHNFSSDVDLVQITNSSGNGVINGSMFYDNSSPSLNFPPGKYPQLENKEVYLINKNTGKPESYTQTGINGNFVLDNIPFGNYRVVADFPGKYAIPVDVSVTQNNPVIDSVLLKVTDDNITGIVKDEAEPFSKVGEIYPNPSEGQCNLPVYLATATEMEISVQSINGQVVEISRYDLSAGQKLLSLDYSHLKSGIYILTTETADNEVNEKQKLIIF